MPMQRLSFERRAGGERLSRTFPVRLRCASSGSVETHAMDVSRTGVRLVSPCALADDRFAVELELEPDLKLSLTGKPVWQQELTRAGQHLVGLSFFVGCDDDERRLDRWILEQQAAA